MKTKEELNQLKNEYKTLNNKLKELTEDELKLVIGGSAPPLPTSPILGSDNTHPDN